MGTSLRRAPVSPIYLRLPVGNFHGWGIFGVAVIRGLAARGPTRLITDELSAQDVGDELEWHQLAKIQLATADLAPFLGTDGRIRLDGPLLTVIPDKTLKPDTRGLCGTRTIGYTFFEENLLAPAWIENGRRYYDVVVTGSSWCTRVLKEHGLKSALTCVQGVDRALFHPVPHQVRTFEPDRFVVYSGGKFEFRKGQDIAIRAYKVLQDRHKDVFLVNSWNNFWQDSFETMRRSTLIRFRAGRQTGPEAINRILAENRIDLSRVLTLGPRPHASLAQVYHNSDVGLFPSRAEGGFNLMLAEYMACGKAAVATATTGQADIVRGTNALVIAAPRTRVHKDERGRPIARWPEPDLEAAVEQLEHAYRNRDQLVKIGQRAASTMTRFGWDRTTERLSKILRS
jgi:glycosyltransferase involved in cell wall biosynthesis